VKEFKFLPLPATTLEPEQDNVSITVVPMVPGELRELHFPAGDTGERFHIGRITCDGRTVSGRRNRRGIFGMSARFNAGSRITLTLSNLAAVPAAVAGFCFGVHIEQTDLAAFENRAKA
jgi:hypothetical protein